MLLTLLLSIYCLCINRPPFDPTYNGDCGCSQNKQQVLQCALSTCDTSLYKKRNVLGIFTFVFVSIVSLILTSKEHAYVLASRKRRLEQSKQRSEKVNHLHLRKLTSAWKALIRRLI